MDTLRVNVTADSLANLNQVSPGVYAIIVYLLDDFGDPIVDSNYPASPFTVNVTTSSTNFNIDIPIVDGSYPINVNVKLFGNETNNECCSSEEANVDLRNCNLIVNTTSVQCNGVVLISMSNYAEPVTFSVKLFGDTVERFLERAGNLLSVSVLYGAPRTYVITATDANGCTDETTFELECIQPTYNVDVINQSCSGETEVVGSIRLFDVQNGTRYKICYDSTACFTNCSVSDGVINLSGDTIIPLTIAAPSTARYVTIRVYNGSGCDLYRDYTVGPLYAEDCEESCPPDGTWSENADGEWYKVVTSSPSAVPSGYNIVAKPSVYYAIDGTRLYAPGLGSFVTLSSTPLWKASTGTNGPMNRCSVWTNITDGGFPLNYLPLNSWVGFTKCLEGLTPGKTYYVGLEADNHFRLIVDGENIFQIVTGDTHFRTWKVIPVVAKKASMLISMEALNTDRLAGFGCEVYDNTYSEIAAATVIGDLTIIFSSESKIGGKFTIGGLSGGIQYGYGCPEGYKYNECTSLCEQVLYCV